MNTTTYTIESVHGVKQTFELGLPNKSTESDASKENQSDSNTESKSKSSTR